MKALEVQCKVWENSLTKVPREVVDPRDRYRVLHTLIGVASGKKWAEICSDGLTLPEYVACKRVSPVFAEIAAQAERQADDMRQLIREEAAHDRAVDGETVPVFNVKGELAGEYKKRSDRLMELLLRGSNPGKYAPSAANAGNSGQVVLKVSFGIPSRVEKVINMEESNEQPRELSAEQPEPVRVEPEPEPEPEPVRVEPEPELKPEPEPKRETEPEPLRREPPRDSFIGGRSFESIAAEEALNEKNPKKKSRWGLSA
jgi:cell division septation protein DedD